ncbi:MAG TPA: hypothetical protein EYN06_05035 [Myxococcales bacterium]|nr:hypothetical protein [Myxococcales bacterium]HIN85826.1 hypothetical protein [Myxococcales bacterium]
MSRWYNSVDRKGSLGVIMLEPYIIEKIKEAERRRRERRPQPEIPLYYEPPAPKPRVEEETEENTGGTVIEIDI